jgi:hypothetical protein
MEKNPRIFRGRAAHIRRYYRISWMQRVENLHRCRCWMMDLVSLTLCDTKCHIADSSVRVFWHANPRLTPLLCSLEGLLSPSSYSMNVGPSSSGGFFLINGLENPLCNLSTPSLKIIQPAGLATVSITLAQYDVQGLRNTPWPVK